MRGWARFASVSRVVRRQRLVARSMGPEELIHRRPTIPSHYVEPVVVQEASRHDDLWLLTVRTVDGRIEEVTLEGREVAEALGAAAAEVEVRLVDPESYWLYVVWGACAEKPDLATFQNPARAFDGVAKPLAVVKSWIISGEALCQARDGQ